MLLDTELEKNWKEHYKEDLNNKFIGKENFEALKKEDTPLKVRFWQNLVRGRGLRLSAVFKTNAQTVTTEDGPAHPIEQNNPEEIRQVISSGDKNQPGETLTRQIVSLQKMIPDIVALGLKAKRRLDQLLVQQTRQKKMKQAAAYTSSAIVLASALVGAAFDARFHVEKAQMAHQLTLVRQLADSHNTSTAFNTNARPFCSPLAFPCAPPPSFSAPWSPLPMYGITGIIMQLHAGPILPLICASTGPLAYIPTGSSIVLFPEWAKLVGGVVCGTMPMTMVAQNGKLNMPAVRTPPNAKIPPPQPRLSRMSLAVPPETSWSYTPYTFCVEEKCTLDFLWDSALRYLLLGWVVVLFQAVAKVITIKKLAARVLFLNAAVSLLMVLNVQKERCDPTSLVIQCEKISCVCFLCAFFLLCLPGETQAAAFSLAVKTATAGSIALEEGCKKTLDLAFL